MTAKLSLPQSSKMLSKDFVYGVATASFQIEGGASKRLPCIWDTFCDTPNKVVDGSNGQTACDHFHLWKEDIALIDLNIFDYSQILILNLLFRKKGISFFLYFGTIVENIVIK